MTIVRLCEQLDVQGQRQYCPGGFAEHYAGHFVRLRQELGLKTMLVQLIAENSWGESTTDYEYLKTERGLAEVNEVADAIGPWIGQLYTMSEIDAHPVSTGLVATAQKLGLAVHPYTFRRDAMAPGFDSFEAMVCWFANTLGVDGMFTDFPDLTMAALGR